MLIYRTLPLALALTACQTTEPAVRVQTVEIRTPVPIYCATAEQLPAEPPHVSDQLTGNAATDIGIIAVSALELRKALRESLALLSGCVEP